VEQAECRFQEGVQASKDRADAKKPRIHSEPAIKRDPDCPWKVFQGEVDWVVAKDAEDALAALAEHYGDPYHKTVGISEAEAREEWEVPCDPDSPLTIWIEPDEWSFREPKAGEVYARQWPIVTRYHSTDPEFWLVKQTAPKWWWAQTNGRGFLCSTEY
jgi:hypothetical protein